jgi:hypothetical protein
VMSIVSETKSHGGKDGLSIPLRRRECSGFRPDASNEILTNTIREQEVLSEFEFTADEISSLRRSKVV